MTAERPGTMRQPGTHMCPHIWAGGSGGGLAPNARLSLSPVCDFDLDLASRSEYIFT